MSSPKLESTENYIGHVQRQIRIDAIRSVCKRSKC